MGNTNCSQVVINCSEKKDQKLAGRWDRVVVVDRYNENTLYKRMKLSMNKEKYFLNSESQSLTNELSSSILKLKDLIFSISSQYVPMSFPSVDFCFSILGCTYFHVIICFFFPLNST